MDFRLVSAKTLLPWTQSLEWDANCRAKLLQENPRITLYNIYIYTYSKYFQQLQVPKPEQPDDVRAAPLFGPASAGALKC